MPSPAAKPTQRAAIYVVAGKDRFLVETECTRLLDEIIPVAERDMGLLSPDADKADVTEVLDELRTPALLAPTKVVMLRGADDFISQNRDILERYFDKPSPSGTLVLTVSSWLKTTKLAKKLPKVGSLIEAGEIKPWHLPDFVMRYAADKYHKTMTRQTAGVLVELTGDEPGPLAGQVDKLAMFAEGRKNITTEDVTAVVGRNRFFDAFEVISTMTAGDTGTAISRLRNMFRSDKDTEYTVIGAFAYHFRRMFQAKVALARGARQDEVGNKLRIWNDKDAFFGHLQKYSLGEIGSVIRRLAAIDHMAKTGQGTIPVAIEQLVVSLGAKRTAPAAGKRR